MDTNSKQFQQLLYPLTASFLKLLESVAPVSDAQRVRMHKIAIELKLLMDDFSQLDNRGATTGTVPETDGTYNGRQEDINESVPPRMVSEIAEPVATAVEEPTTVFPKNPNWFRENANTNDGICFFNRLTSQDGTNKRFQFYIAENEGQFSMKDISVDNWIEIYDNRNRIFLPGVVTVEGTMEPSAACTSIERGLVKRDGKMWVVVKPCVVKITPC